MLIIPAVYADTAPYYVESVPNNAMGVYQTDKELTLYEAADKNSEIIKTIEFSYKKETMPEGSFALLINEKQLGFLYVTDIDEDGWVEILYDRKNNLKGWTQTADRMQFLPWMNFYNMYGRKYGIRILKDAPENTYTLHAKNEDLSQSLSKLNHVQKIKLTKISGNWALVSAMDLDKTPKTGWLKWRDSDGTIYVFPNIK
jgi:hypothetical protein